jgi:hypothetical protein
MADVPIGSKQIPKVTGYAEPGFLAVSSLTLDLREVLPESGREEIGGEAIATAFRHETEAHLECKITILIPSNRSLRPSFPVDGG